MNMKKALFISLCALLLAGTGCKKNAEPEPHKVIVTSVSVKPSSLSLKVGETAQLTATVTPVNADNDNVSWSTSDNSVATVADGLVTAVKEGTATITVTTIDGGKTATCAVTVSADVVPVTGIKLNMETADLEVGKTLQLEAILEPANTTERNVTWVSKPEVATVDENGLVTGVGPGYTQIIAKIGKYSASAYVYMTVPMEAVDMGLSVKWGSHNLGAFQAKDAMDIMWTKQESVYCLGYYYAWGEVEPKDDYSVETYKFWDAGKEVFTKYITPSYYADIPDYKTQLDQEDDAAHALLGDLWRIPTAEELKELLETRNSSEYSWERDYYFGDANYYVWTVTCLSNGNSIQIELPGCRQEDSRRGQGKDGKYWSSTLDANSPNHAKCINIGYDSNGSISSLNRWYGYSIRPVYGELQHPTAVKLNKTEATRYAGGVLQLKATVTPANAADKTVIWTSSNDDVANVADNGYVIVKAEGEAIITATTMDGGLTAQCKLTVNPIPDGAVFSADAFNSSTGEEPLLILQQDLSNSTVYIRKSSGTIDFNGHTVKYLYMQNNDPNKVVGLCNGIISGRLDGDAGWYRYTGQTFHGKVMMEDMEVYKEFYTDGHVYTLNSGYYETVCTFRVGDALGDVYIYGGSFGKLFDVNPDAGSNQGDIFLFGGKFAIDPRTYTNAGTTNPSGNTRFIIGEGYSVKDNTEEDKDEFPYIVSKD